jgi:hypothetical protein
MRGDDQCVCESKMQRVFVRGRRRRGFVCRALEDEMWFKAQFYVLRQDEEE